MNVSRSSDSERLPRKRMRKGTHCCKECRQRKVRCVVESGSSKCNECIARGYQCNEQEHHTVSAASSAERKRSTRQRVNDLEVMLDRMAYYAEFRDAPQNARTSNRGTAGSSDRLPDRKLSPALKLTGNLHDCTKDGGINGTAGGNQSFKKAPLLDMLGSGDADQEGDHENDTSTKDHQLDANTMQTIQGLKACLPNVRELASMLRSGQNSWAVWQRTFPELNDSLKGAEEEQITRLRDFIYTSINSESVGVVAKIMLCLTLHIQQLPSNLEAARVSMPAPSETLQRYHMKLVDTLLESDEGLAGTLDGLECMILQTQFYIDIGNMRRVWLIVRRAVNLAQLLGLHQDLETANDQLALRRSALWQDLWQRDRGFSLILGLPYAVPESLCSTSTTTGYEFRQSKVVHFSCSLGIIMGHIIDRNQDRSKMTYSVTLRIDEELEECKKILPDSWWETLPDSNMSSDGIREIFVAKLRYHMVRKLLHLPFMLKSYTDLRYNASRVVALECSRAMIEVFKVLRDERRPVMNMCDMLDFEVFGATMTMVVDLLGHWRSSRCYDHDQGSRDWQSVHEVMVLLRRTSQSMVCTVAAKGAKVLEDFYNARNGSPDSADQLFDVDIPYFGKVSIRRPLSAALSSRSASLSEVNKQMSSAHVSHGVASELGFEPFVSLDSYLYPFSGTAQPWQGEEASWISMFDSSIGDNWNWFPNSAELE